MTILDFWPTPEAVTRCIPSEAEVISDAAFLAVHQPIRLFRRSLTSSDAPVEPADERAVLDALLTPHLPEGYVVVPVEGPSGVGKSHLIRWLGLHVSGNRHVIRIPKSTSLRDILKSILKGLEGPAYDEIREQLKTAREQLDKYGAEEDLLAKFRAALLRRRDQAKQECDEAIKTTGRADPAVRAVAELHADGLYSLLEGPTKDVLLQDTDKRKSVFRALVKRVTTGLIEAENGQFAADDFAFPTIQPARLQNIPQRYLGLIRGNTSDARKLRSAAADLMNHVKDWAVGQLLGVGENQLAQLFGQVREELFKEGKELVLLIEDFTTLAGVQYALLDVIKVEGVRTGEAEKCLLRTALAVTEGYLSPFDTVKSRLGYGFVLQEQPAAEDELIATATNMVGAYLNAARLGPDRLRDWFEGTDRNPDAKPPSFELSATHLPDADREALEAFSKSSAGHSLFPFNRAAVRQLARQHLTEGGQFRLNPRKLIKDVLHVTLLHERDRFTRGEFLQGGVPPLRLEPARDRRHRVAGDRPQDRPPAVRRPARVLGRPAPAPGCRESADRRVPGVRARAADRRPAGARAREAA
ncbi:MAG: ATP-binding protein [Gemmataceae bacterium]